MTESKPNPVSGIKSEPDRPKPGPQQRGPGPGLSLIHI